MKVPENHKITAIKLVERLNSYFCDNIIKGENLMLLLNKTSMPCIFYSLFEIDSYCNFLVTIFYLFLLFWAQSNGIISSWISLPPCVCFDYFIFIFIFTIFPRCKRRNACLHEKDIVFTAPIRLSITDVNQQYKFFCHCVNTNNTLFIDILQVMKAIHRSVS